MMGERPLSVVTSTAAMQVVGKRHYGRKALPAGGGGGSDLTDLIRTDFKPVLLWRGRVKLDAQGRAEIDVPLADSLSAYKLVAIATAGGDLFGTGSATIRTVQDSQSTRPSAAGALRRRIWGDLHSAERNRQADDRDRERRARAGAGPAARRR